MGILIITDTDRAAIRAAIEAARARPMPLDELTRFATGRYTPILSLADRPDGTAELRARYPSQALTLGTYEISLSFEQQPAGLVRHLSVSAAGPRYLPNRWAMEMLAREFGFRAYPPTDGTTWIEEYAPGRHAINVVELVNEAPNDTGPAKRVT